MVPSGTCRRTSPLSSSASTRASTISPGCSADGGAPNEFGIASSEGRLTMSIGGPGEQLGPEATPQE
jgi:hypothetical protein